MLKTLRITFLKIYWAVAFFSVRNMHDFKTFEFKRTEIMSAKLLVIWTAVQYKQYSTQQLQYTLCSKLKSAQDFYINNNENFLII